ncbi:putative chromatin-associated protein swi6 [Amylocarpus encephaloides]|uniref:Chromatin-associated protein swi6 n=1 Tax=Amylocarpus encephaloides TaxID=45428 RepID=A0A9P7YSF3_9HELO|nr:putative chromatin-associated protein swi6 [Amylocarpus encephaloides]
MPPQLSDGERSESESYAVPVRQQKSSSAKSEPRGKSVAVEEESLPAATSEGEVDEEMGEDEYTVEKIMSHLIDDETGELIYEIKWEGYEKKSDRTWEPEENLETASAILAEYLESYGGKEKILAEFEEKKAGKGGKGKKRARSSTGLANNGTAPKKGRKSHPAETTPPMSARKEFKPPTGTWEEDVIHIDAVQGQKPDDVIVYLTWKGDHRTQHPLSQVYKRCPQKMLKFYEKHLVFKKTDPEEEVKGLTMRIIHSCNNMCFVFFRLVQRYSGVARLVASRYEKKPQLVHASRRPNLIPKMY